MKGKIPEYNAFGEKTVLRPPRRNSLCNCGSGKRSKRCCYRINPTTKTSPKTKGAK